MGRERGDDQDGETPERKKAVVPIRRLRRVECLCNELHHRYYYLFKFGFGESRGRGFALRCKDSRVLFCRFLSFVLLVRRRHHCFLFFSLSFSSHQTRIDAARRSFLSCPVLPSLCGHALLRCLGVSFSRPAVLKDVFGGTDQIRTRTLSLTLLHADRTHLSAGLLRSNARQFLF